jgi:hypothetical protein
MRPSDIAELYFSYGSNLLPARLTARAPSARLVSTGYCVGRRLAFHKVGRDGSAKCDAPSTPGSVSRIYGALYEMDAADTKTLDDIEGVGNGYDTATLSVVTTSGHLDAFAYLAQPVFVRPGLAPFEWYKLLVLEGARYHGFPQRYRASIASVKSVPDPDSDRRTENLSALSGI